MATFLMVDGHVHAYTKDQLRDLLPAAARHFAANAPPGSDWSGLLLLADPRGIDSEAWLAGPKALLPTGWQADGGEPPRLFHFRAPTGQRISILRGHQLVTSEGLELLAIGATSPAPPAPLATMIEAGRSAGHLVIIPWGVGKWLGGRGRLLKATLEAATGGGVLLGENGGRPWFWPVESLIADAQARGIPLLPGSDPLPLPGETGRVGSIGAIIEPLREVDSTEALLTRLAAGGWRRYGPAMGASRFLRNQVGLRMARKARSRGEGPQCES